MKKVGILTGREVTFPESIIRSINEKGNGDLAMLAPPFIVTHDEIDLIVERFGAAQAVEQVGVACGHGGRRERRAGERLRNADRRTLRAAPASPKPG